MAKQCTEKKRVRDKNVQFKASFRNGNFTFDGISTFELLSTDGLLRYETVQPEMNRKEHTNFFIIL